MTMDEAQERMMMQLEGIKMDMQQYQQQKSQLMMTVQELSSAKATVDALRSAKKDEEIIVPIGGGVFIKGKVMDPSTVIASVGADVAVTKDLDGALALIDERAKMLNDSVGKIDEAMMTLEKQAQDIYGALEASSTKK